VTTALELVSWPVQQRTVDNKEEEEYQLHLLRGVLRENQSKGKFHPLGQKNQIKLKGYNTTIFLKPSLSTLR
jgi:hypothetical protein